MKAYGANLPICAHVRDCSYSQHKADAAASDVGAAAGTKRHLSGGLAFKKRIV